MRSVKVKELTLENFSKYGSFANMINPDVAKFGDAPIEFFPDMVLMDLGAATTAAFSVCRVTKRPATIDLSEMHTSTGEGSMPLDGDVLIHVGPVTPDNNAPVNDIEVFRVPKGTFVSLRPGVWHHAAFAENADAVNVLIVLPQRTYANDCFVDEFAEADRITIQ